MSRMIENINIIRIFTYLNSIEKISANDPIFVKSFTF